MNLISGISQFFSGSKAVAPVTEERAMLTPEQWFAEWINGTEVAGVNVNAESAMTVSAVYACCALLSRTIASLSLGMYQRDGRDIIEITESPEAYAVCIEPNDLYTSYTWRSTAQFHLSLRGNHYSRIHTDRYGYASRFEILHPDHVQPFLYKNKLYYQVITLDFDGVLTAGEVLHLKNFSEDGLIGKSPLTAARDTIGMAISSNKYASAMYENGGGLKGIVTAPMALNDKQVQAIREGMLSVMRDYKRTGSIGVLQGGAAFQQVAISPKDAQFIESAKLTIQDVARFYGVPLHLIGDLERSTNNNIEHQSIEFLQHTIRPIVKNWESELNRRAIRKYDKGTRYFRFNLDSLLRGDSASRATYFQTMLNNGVYSINEVRAMDNLNPVEGGDTHHIQVNMSTLENINTATQQQQDGTGADTTV